MSDAASPKQEPPKARIPIRKIWLHEGIDLILPGGSHGTNTGIGVIDCSAAKAPSQPFFVAHFVPAHQVIELEWFKNEKAEPHRMRVPMTAVKRFD